MKIKYLFIITMLLLIFENNQGIAEINNPSHDIQSLKVPLLVPEHYPTIQAAIDSSMDGDMISIAPGTYYENLLIRNKGLSIKSRMGPELTVVDGGRKTMVLQAYNLSLNNKFEVKGLTFRNGFGINPSFPTSGIFLNPGMADTTLIENCIIECNTDTLKWGFTVYFGFVYKEPVIFKNTIFRNNSSDYLFSGAGYNYNTLILDHCDIYENQVGEFFYYDLNHTYMYYTVIRNHDCGVGIYGQEAIGCQFIDNPGGFYGVFGYMKDTIVKNNGLNANCNLKDYSFFHNGEPYVIEDCIFTGNISYGPVVYLPSLLKSCIVANNINYADGDGGAVWMNGNDRIENSLIINNEFRGSGGPYYSTGGGGIFVYSGNVEIVHSTIDNNWSKYLPGSGIFVREGSTAHIVDCIITNNRGEGIHGNPGVTPAQVYVTYSDVWNNVTNYSGTASPGEGCISVDPLFVGGKHKDLHLRGSSPCIDRGIDAGVYVDIEGDRRPFGSGFDMGADEWTGAGTRR